MAPRLSPGVNGQRDCPAICEVGVPLGIDRRDPRIQAQFDFGFSVEAAWTQREPSSARCQRDNPSTGSADRLATRYRCLSMIMLPRNSAASASPPQQIPPLRRRRSRSCRAHQRAPCRAVSAVRAFADEDAIVLMVDLPDRKGGERRRAGCLSGPQIKTCWCHGQRMLSPTTSPSPSGP